MLILACSTQELADGDGRPALGAPDVAIFRVAGEFYATQDSCSHEQWSLGEDGEFEGYQVVCPLHQARFDIRDGRPLCLPALTALRTYPVVVRDGRVMIDIPDDHDSAAVDAAADLSSPE
ncbi:non-heme iron oxygenase ferredoxin subunit [Mycobacterium montefiorense]|uniref:non-heme iron oxygenase ferredoxin subunit n=1 Tax=Mycobacterium montefiorense TaxID=154654 RepID=UPI0021F387A6|nr:non-heme iron oxygenase ferredoxin subunit [Mycobacterium montefiorense]MCV7426669.1 non-heme iron oxygenase ferredoxin subunit [Mycobacterium montefiorense]